MTISLREVTPQRRGWLICFGVLAAIAAAGLGSAAWIEHHGHVVTGMNNRIVWGLPHVFAVFLIVAASGALNVASMASVFGRKVYKPLAPLSALLALALLVGGLSVLMLDLGRPDRLIVAMTHYNFKSIFAWNVFLYSGFMVLAIVYLWTMVERRMNRFTTAVGVAAFVWRIALTTGTGSIFGFLVAHQGFDSALLAPLFVALSLSYGLAAFVLVLMLICAGSGRPLGDALLQRLARLQAILIGAGLYFVIVHHLTNLYFTKHHGFERFVLADGGVHTLLFWAGQILIGSLVPLVLLLTPALVRQRRVIALAAGAVLAGALAQMEVTIIGGQAYPMALFPGRDVSSSFADGVVAAYGPSLAEALLGLGGIAIAGLIVVVAVRVLALIPERLDDAVLAAD